MKELTTLLRVKRAQQSLQNIKKMCFNFPFVHQRKSTSMCLCASAYLVSFVLRLRLQKENKLSSMQRLK